MTDIAKAQKIADAVLYEGYMLYPYRASALKNRQRFSFGTLWPEGHPDVVRGVERCHNQTQCLLTGTDSCRVRISIRFLQMQSRNIGEGSDGRDQSWEEAVERTVDIGSSISDVLGRPHVETFEFAPFSRIENIHDKSGGFSVLSRRTQLGLKGRIRISGEQLGIPTTFRLTVECVNSTPFVQASDREATLLSAFASAHTILSTDDGEFISLLDPPPHLRDAAQACRNIGLYPVLVGESGDRQVLLASPIILYDYPQVAPESAGDFFDGTEIDELLTLRVITLTDEEKREMRDSDPRVRELLERTEATAREQLARTHGAIRNLRPLKDNAA